MLIIFPAVLPALPVLAHTMTTENAGSAHSMTMTADDGSGSWMPPPHTGPVSTWTAPMRPLGVFVPQVFFFYTQTTGRFDETGTLLPLPEGCSRTQSQEQLFMQYSLARQFDLVAQFSFFQNRVAHLGSSANASGLGDTLAFMRYAFIEEQRPVPI
jgi:hypothetical protein